MNHEATHSLAPLARLLAGVAILVLAAPLFAQQGAPPAPPGHEELTPKQRQELQSFVQAREQLAKLQDQLQQIQEQTLAARPELQQQQAELVALLEKEMKSKGHTPEKDMSDLKALEQKLEQAQDEPERQALLNEMQEKSLGLRQAQRDAMQSEAVQQAYQNFANAMIVAMKEEHPKTEALIQEAEQKRQELIKLQESLMQ